MKNIKQIIGIIIIAAIMICGCGSNNSNNNSSEISVNDSKQEVTVRNNGTIRINDNAMRTLVTYPDSTRLTEFITTHAVYVYESGISGYSYSAPLIGPNGYNCLYSEDGYVYESITNVIIYDFR